MYSVHVGMCNRAYNVLHVHVCFPLNAITRHISSILIASPTLSRVVMARVAMLLLVSEMRFSRSTLHEVTASGWNMAIRLRVFTAEKRIVGFEEVKNICNTGGRG